jgi:hypothetical protein
MSDEMQKETQEAEIPMRPATSNRKDPKPSRARLKKRQEKRQSHRKDRRR